MPGIQRIDDEAGRRWLKKSRDIALTIEREKITGKVFPEDEFSLGLFLFAFSTAIGSCLVCSGILTGIRKQDDTDGKDQQEKKRYAEIEFGFHEHPFAVERNYEKKGYGDEKFDQGKHLPDNPLPLPS